MIYLVYLFILSFTNFPCVFMSYTRFPESVLQQFSRVVPISRNKLSPYRAVIIIRLVILGFFFHYRITNPVDSAYGMWLTSIICEIWFAVSWVLDQFPKWNPINREAFIDVLSARYVQKPMNFYPSER